MRRTFLLDAEGRPCSALVQDHEDEANPFYPGRVIMFSKAVDLSPYTMLTENERGRVEQVHKDTGLVTIRLEKDHWGLAPWLGCAWLIPFDTDEILSAINLL